MTETSEYDVAIIGAGVAGLTAALFAARLGHSTVVIERFLSRRPSDERREYRRLSGLSQRSGGLRAWSVHARASR